MGFIIHFYIIFGTNLLTGAQPKLLFFCLFQCFEGKEYQTESKRNKTFGNVIFGTNVIQRTWSGRQEINEEATRAPRSSTDLLLSPIYTHIPWKHHIRSQNPISTAATFCSREIPSWDLFRRSAGGGFDHRGPLNQPCHPFDDS